MNLEEIIKNQRDEIQALKSALNTAEKRCDQFAQAYDQMPHQLKELIRNRFGKKSERFIDPENPQLSIFKEENSNVFSIADAAGAAITEEEIEIPTHTRKKKKIAGKDLPRRIVIVPLKEEEKICSCGSCKDIIRYEVKELMHYQSTVFEIVEQRREVAACPKGCDGAIVTAPAPLQALPKVKVTEEFLSFLVVSKLDDRQPLYHLEKQLSERYGVVLLPSKHGSLAH